MSTHTPTPTPTPTPSLRPGNDSAAAANPLLTILKGVLADPFAARAHRQALLDAGRRAGLSEDLAARVAELAHRTGLWRGEQLDVARELAAHFADANASGTGASDFGNDDDAARLIARAKKRSRPPVWRFVRAFVLMLLALTVLVLGSYGVMAYRYFNGKPTLTRNVLKELNDPVLATPEQDRAWPLYVRSVGAIGPRLDAKDKQFAWPLHATDPGFAAARDWLAARPEAVPSILAAASKPTLGYVYSNSSDPAYDEAVQKVQGTELRTVGRSTNENPIATSILLVPLGHLRQCARILAADAAVAAKAGDGARFVRDIEALYAMAAHAREDRLLISELVGMAIAETAHRSLALHVAQPGLLTDDQLKRLADLVAGYGGARPIRFDLGRERAMIDDVIQRTYTDDGRGDGRHIRGTLDDDLRELGYPDQTGAFPPTVFRPLVALRAPSRARLVAMTDAAFQRAEADQALPLRRLQERTSSEEMELLDQQAFQSVTSLGVVPALSRAFLSRDLFEARRDGLLVGIALERFRLRNGSYPQSLDRLVPELLPLVPADPLADAPIRYRLASDGAAARPLVYSVFLDGIDDQGRRAPMSSKAAPGPSSWITSETPEASMFAPDIATPPSGDWILYQHRPSTSP